MSDSSPVTRVRLDDKVALVTGGSKGIGLATATALAAVGASIMISSRKREALEDAAKAIVAATGSEVATYAGNAGDPDAAQACVQATVDRFGGLDVLVNNAGTNPYFGPTIDVDLGRYDKTMQVNVRGPLVWSQAAWRAAMADRGGVIINMASVGGIRAGGGIGVYDVTKAALIHLTRVLAAELAPGVRVNALAPGLVRTEFARALWEANESEAVNRTVLGRLGVPEDVAGAVVFLASDLSSWMTGQVVVVDGGALLR